MTMKRVRIASAALMLFASPATVAAQDASLETEIVDALNEIFGTHPGFRAAHAKGIVAKGSFTASPTAGTLSKAVLFDGHRFPVTVRFSNSTGLPNIPDGSAAANPHGLAIKCDLPDGNETDFVLNSLKFFPVSTGVEFRDMLRAVAASPPDADRPTKIQQFVASHPNVLRANATTGTPASFAEEEYNGINAFVLVSESGARQAVRLKATPEKITHLDAAEALKRAPNFLIDELASRLSQGVVTFRLKAQLATPADSTKDPSQPWPDSNKVVDLGLLTIDRLVPNSLEVQKDLLFLPGRVIDGIEVSDDPMISVRDGAYAVSFSRRAP